MHREGALIPIPVVQARPVPEDILSLAGFIPDYADVFGASVPMATDVAAEEWARAAMEGAHPAGRFMAWRVLCNLSLGPHSTPDFIAGWKVAERAYRWIRVEAKSSFMTANIVFQTLDGRVNFATLIRYDRPIGRVIWGTISMIHRRIAPDFLRAGVVRVVRRSATR